MDNLRIFPERLKEIRTKLNLTQKELGDMVGANSATISAYETGIKNPSLGIVKEIAEKCNISLDWLCGLSIANNENEITTYSDLIKLFVKISKKIDFIIACKSIDMNGYYSTELVGELLFSDCRIIEFLNEWDKTKSLYDEDIIDSELYDLWIDKKTKEDKYNVPLAETTRVRTEQGRL